METIEFYVVKNKDGKYLRGSFWVTDLKRAKIHTKRGPALSLITKMVLNGSENEPELVPIICTIGEPINQDERLAKVMKKRELDETKTQLRRAEQALKIAIKEMEMAKGHYFKGKLVEAHTEIARLTDKIINLTKNKES